MSWRLRFAPSAARGAVWGQLASASCHWEHQVGLCCCSAGGGQGRRTRLGCGFLPLGAAWPLLLSAPSPKRCEGRLPPQPGAQLCVRLRPCCKAAAASCLQLCTLRAPSSAPPLLWMLRAALDAPCRPAMGSSCRWCSLLRVLRTNEQTNKLFLDGKIKAKVLPAALMVLEHLGVVKVFMEKL